MVIDISHQSINHDYNLDKNPSPHFLLYSFLISSDNPTATPSNIISGQIQRWVLFLIYFVYFDSFWNFQIIKPNHRPRHRRRHLFRLRMSFIKVLPYLVFDLFVFFDIRFN